MAKIIENNSGRRTIRLSTNDIIDVVREYQALSKGCFSYEETRKVISEVSFYLPEDID